MRKINYIIIHNSDSSWGDAKVIDSWHKERGFDSIGYHKVILNGRQSYGSKYDVKIDGIIEDGRPDEIIGAHCRGMNENSLAVCIIGKLGDAELPTKSQLQSLLSICKNWMEKYNILVSNIIGHREAQQILKYTTLKLCPSFDIAKVRYMLLEGTYSLVRNEQERLKKIKELALEIITKC